MTEQTDTRKLPVELGQVVITSNLYNQLEAAHTPAEILREIASLILRHQRGDWGDVHPEDTGANDQALEDGTRLLSVYPLFDFKVWIITEADRGVTTVLLPEDY